jgi:hypothetical protein
VLGGVTQLRDAIQHPLKNQSVKRVKGIPIQQATQSDQIENGGQVDRGAMRVTGDFELEPCPARHMQANVV